MVPGFGRSQTRPGFTSPGRVCAVCHPQPVATTHLARTDELTPICGAPRVLDADTGEYDVITMAEARNPDGRHFDCVECHKRLHGPPGAEVRHVRPPSEDESP